MKVKKIFTRKFMELSGSVHNHSCYSYDSNQNVEKIITLAKKQGLDFITINDHNNFAAAKDEAVKNVENLFVIVGAEINDKNNNNHLLVFDTKKLPDLSDVKDYVSFYTDQKAIRFVAHPFERRLSKQFRKYQWTDKSIDDFDGIEIWNYVSAWLGHLRPSINGLLLVLFPSTFVKKPLRDTLTYWDELNLQGKRRAAIGSTDAHSVDLQKFGLKLTILTHKMLFKTIRTNVLLPEDENIDNKTILAAMKRGNSYVVNYKVGVPYNFYAGIKADNGGEAIFGEEFKLDGEAKLYFRLPFTAKVKLIRNGEKIASKRDDLGYFFIRAKGNYRLEIEKNLRGWIYTNNIYVI
jgi:hypothetical protein